MSSIRVRAQNKMFEKIGAAKRSTNIQFDTAHSGFNAMEADVLSFNKALCGFISTLRGYHLAATTLASSVHGIMNTNEPNCPPEMKQFVGLFAEIVQVVDVNKFNALLTMYDKTVMSPAEGWLAQCDQLKEKVELFREDHSNYDHYTRKVVSMREQRDKRVTSGKSEKTKEVDKLMRNEQKLVESTKKYRESSEATIKNLKDFSLSRYTTLNPMVQRLIQFRIHYATEMEEATHKFSVLLRSNGENDAHLEKLQKLAIMGQMEKNSGNGITDVDLNQTKKKKIGILGRRTSKEKESSSTTEESTIDDSAKIKTGNFDDFVAGERGTWNNSKPIASDQFKRDSFGANLTPSASPSYAPVAPVSPTRVVQFDIPQKQSTPLENGQPAFRSTPNDCNPFENFSPDASSYMSSSQDIRETSRPPSTTDNPYNPTGWTPPPANFNAFHGMQ